MNPCVVMPSIRQPNLDYLEPLGSTPIVVIDDSNGNIKKDLAPHITVLDYADKHKLLGPASWLIPEKNPSCKNLGMYWAWKEGFDTLILLDDDCDCRVTPNFLYEIPIGRDLSFHQVNTRCGWVNTMQCLTNSEGMWSRGFPYEQRHSAITFSESLITVNSKFNEGLWTGTPDINGVDKFITPFVTTQRELTANILVPEEVMLPLSIMNVQLHRDLVPAFYQPPDYSLPGGHRIRRHDDVWSMMVLKHLMDLKGDVATVGGPLVWHRKEGDMTQEMLSEHGTNLIQPYLYRTLEKTSNWFIGSDSSYSYAELARSLSRMMGGENRAPGCFMPIIDDYTKRIGAWAELFL